MSTIERVWIGITGLTGEVGLGVIKGFVDHFGVGPLDSDGALPKSFADALVLFGVEREVAA